MLVHLRFGLLLALVSCGGNGKQPPGPDRAASPEAPGAPAEQPTTEPAPEPLAPAPAIELRGELEDGSVAPILRNRDDQTVSLSTELAVQRRGDDGWRTTDSQVALRWSCDKPAQRCISLVPGAEFLPPVWEGALGPAQCGCKDCKTVPAGTYRFVARGCDERFVLEGIPFEL